MIEIPLLNDLPPDIKEGIIRITLAVFALTLIWALRRAVMWLIAKLSSRWLDNQSDVGRGKLVSVVLKTPVRLLVIALGLFAATQILTPDGNSLIFISRLSRSIVILAVAIAIVQGVDIVIASRRYVRRLTGIQIEDQLLPFMKTALKVVIVALVLVMILQEWNYDVGGLIAGFGLAGLAFSLAAQETVANLFAFGTIVSDRPFEVGEFIITPEVEGTVDSIGPRSTRIRRLDQAYVTIPNTKIANSAVTNWSRLQKRWMNFILGVTYSSSSQDLRHLLNRLREMLQSYERVDRESVLVHFVEFGDSSLNILVRLYVPEPDWGVFQAEKETINLRIMDVVEELGLSIAFPSRSIYVENLPSLLPATRELQTNTASPRQNILPTAMEVDPVVVNHDGSEQDGEDGKQND